jgi:hypothetical protein
MKSAKVGVAMAFGASALVLDRAFEIMGKSRDATAIDDMDQLRTMVYMVRCAYAHGIAEPRWEVKDKYLRTLNFNLDGVRMCLDLSELNGEPFNFD